MDDSRLLSPRGCLQVESVLIVGAGVVGARVARGLAARNFAPDRAPTRVAAWTRSAAAARLLAAEGIVGAAAVDIVPPALAAGAPPLPVDPAGYDCVYFCAVPNSHSTPERPSRDRAFGGARLQDAQAIYVDGYARVLAALEGCARLPRRIVLAGSSGVIGDHAGATVDETVARDADSPRGKILCACEDQLRGFAERHAAAQVSAVILRLVGLYGAARNPLAALQAGRYRYPGDPDKGINLLHLSDATAALVAAGSLPLAAGATEVIHCSDGQFPTRREYIEAICRRFDLPLPALPPPPRQPAESAGTRVALAVPTATRPVGDRRIANNKMRTLLLRELAYSTYAAGLDSFELAPASTPDDESDAET